MAPHVNLAQLMSVTQSYELMVLAALRGSVLLLTCAAAGIDVINCDEVSGNPHLIGGIGETSRGKCMTLIESLPVLQVLKLHSR
jgi:hypothetical protein